jgi:ATP-dependent helicase/nuclease subunit A
LFLQWVPLESTSGAQALKSAARQLEAEGILSAEQADVLNFGALEAFWRSELGQKIRQHARYVRRELAFTVRLSPLELPVQNRTWDAQPPSEDFVVVQGVADLAVLQPEEIWLVDFKTDQIAPEELVDRVAFYQSQIDLYGLGLSRIYRRPVSERWLHFLALNQTVAL